MSNEPADADALGPVVKSLVVPLPPEQAFELFTTGMSRWWPLDSHSVGEDHAHAVLVDGTVGGAVTEWIDDGRSEVWGRVTAWEPPGRVALDWFPGHPEKEATHLEVTFVPADGGTRVELTHSRWSARSDGELARAEYDHGWDYVLGRYAGRAAAP